MSIFADWRVLRTVGSYFGVAGVGGSGFAALCFGIGYLAIKNHDEMIGLPTTVTNYTTYVRAGALFFPNSIYYMLSAVIGYIFLVGISALMLRLAITLVGFFASERDYTKISQQWRKMSAFVESGSFVLAYVVLFILAIYLVHLQVAAFDPVNKNLLNTLLEERDALRAELDKLNAELKVHFERMRVGKDKEDAGQKDQILKKATDQGSNLIQSELGGKDKEDAGQKDQIPKKAAAQGSDHIQNELGGKDKEDAGQKDQIPREAAAQGRLRVLPTLKDTLTFKRTNALAHKIRDHLRMKTGREWLHKLYGEGLALTVLLFYGILLAHQWEKGLSKKAVAGGPQEKWVYSLPIVKWVIHPILYGIMIALILSVPANYGILCLPNGGTTVKVKLNNVKELSEGTLLSDLSSEPEEIWILGTSTDDKSVPTLRVYQREDISEIQLTKEVENILVLEKSEEIRKEIKELQNPQNSSRR